MFRFKVQGFFYSLGFWIEVCLRGALCNFIVQGVGGFLQFLQ